MYKFYPVCLQERVEMKNPTMILKRFTVTLVVMAVLALLPACFGKEASITVPAGAQAGSRASTVMMTRVTVERLRVIVGFFISTLPWRQTG